VIVRLGFLLAIVSAFSFGMAGALASGLLEAGWSPGSAVTARMAIGALALTVPALLAFRGRWHAVHAQWPALLTYGVVAVAGAQFCYFSAVARLPVGVALLIEYTSPVSVVLWMWLRHGHRPTRLIVAGAAVALFGLTLLLDLFATTRSLDPIGIAWSLAAMVGATVYFVISGRSESGVPSVGLAWFGLLIGACTMAILAVVTGLPMAVAQSDVPYRGHSVPWVLPVLALGLVTAALAYLTGIGGVRRLGPRLAAFVGLCEVLAAVLFAWLLLAQLPSPTQLVGGLLVLAGVGVVQAGDRPRRVGQEVGA
jgi:drug/metabolite transporter (DMT)-like permease